MMTDSRCSCSDVQQQRGEYLGRLVRQHDIGPEHQSMILAFTGAAASNFIAARAGQFIEVACRDLDSPRTAAPLLRRPFSIAGVSESAPADVEVVGQSGDSVCYVEIIFRTLGPGTSYMTHRRLGETLNVLGPLGNGFCLPTDPAQPAILIGGGVGMPPMFFMAEQLARCGCSQVIALAGAQTAQGLVGTVDEQPGADGAGPQPMIEEFERHNIRSLIATDDGSCGRKGTVVDILVDLLRDQPEWRQGAIFTCGPHGMLRAVARVAHEQGMACQVSMESYMACGIGVCQSCVVPMKQASPDEGPCYKLACTDGPVFAADEVDWEADEH